MKIERCEGPVQPGGFVFADGRDEACMALGSSSQWLQSNGNVELLLSLLLSSSLLFLWCLFVLFEALSIRPIVGAYIENSLRTNSAASFTNIFPAT